MFDFFDEFLDFLIDIYICNSIGAVSMAVVMMLSFIEGIITYYYFKRKGTTFDDVKIYTLLIFRLVIFLSAICFKFWFALILSFLAIMVSKKIEKRLYEFKIDEINSSALEAVVNSEFQKIKTSSYIGIGLIYFCIGLVFSLLFE